MHAPKQPTNPIGTNQETKKGGPDLNKQRMVTEPKEGVPILGELKRSKDEKSIKTPAKVVAYMS